MARASTQTWLPLDEWARMMGVSLWHFNGIKFDETCDVRQVPCSGIWYQHPWHGPRLSREDVAIAIREAEQTIATFVGYNLLPDYHREVVVPQPHHRPEFRTSYTPQGLPKSVQLSRGYVWEGGVRKKELLDTVAIIRVDKDGDGLKETARITLNTSVHFNELRFYYPGEEGVDAWEIRPVKFVSYNNPYVIEVPMYQLVKKIHIESLCHDDNALQANDDSIYLTEVEVYRVYTDKTHQARLIYAPPYGCLTGCDETYKETCLTIEDHELGYVRYNPGYPEPDRVEVFYQSGWIAPSGVQRPYVDMDPYWKTAVAYFAAGLLDKAVICCGGIQSDAASRWREELDRIHDRSPQFMSTARQIENPFGIPTRGSWYAYNKAKARRIR